MGKQDKLKERQERQVREMWEKHWQRVERTIAAFNHAHMSNAKWRKLFLTLSSPELGLSMGRWKFVGGEHIFNWGFPEEFDLLETRLEDGHFQPIEYREIEWIEIPGQYVIEDKTRMGNPRKIVYQDVERALEALNKVGQFPAELTETGLIIRGYS